MSVLARELTAYQDAVDQYNRQAAAFQRSLLTDANGNVLVYKGTFLGGGSYYSVPAGGGNATSVTSFTPKNGQTITNLDAYGRTASSGDPDVKLVRQNPSSTTTSTVGNLAQMTDDFGSTVYYMVDPETGRYIDQYVPNTHNVKYTPDPKTGLYTATEYFYQYPNDPGAFNKQRPDPTAAQLRKLTQPTLAEQERGGLIADEIQQGGVLSNPGRKLAPVETPASTHPFGNLISNGGGGVDNTPVDYSVIY